MLHPLLKNMLQTIDHFEISCLGAPFSWLEKPRNHMGRDLDCIADVLMRFHRSTFSKPNEQLNSDLAPMQFLGFSNHEKGAPRQEIFEKWVEHCMKCITCQGRYLKEIITLPPQSSNSE
jgi:hypothetical protein